MTIYYSITMASIGVFCDGVLRPITGPPRSVPRLPGGIKDDLDALVRAHLWRK